MAEKKDADWALIRADFEAGMSLRTLEAKYGVNYQTINKKAKKYGWTKDLGPKIEKRVKARLQAATVREARKAKLLPEQPEYPDSRPLTEDQIIDANADVTVHIVTGHRDAIGRAKVICLGLFEELGAMNSMDLRELLEEAILEDTKDADTGIGTAKKGAQMRRSTMLAAVSLSSRAAIMDRLGGSLKTVVRLEREAYNINVDTSADDDVTAALRALNNTPVPAPDGQ